MKIKSFTQWMNESNGKYTYSISLIYNARGYKKPDTYIKKITNKDIMEDIDYLFGLNRLLKTVLKTVDKNKLGIALVNLNNFGIPKDSKLFNYSFSNQKNTNLEYSPNLINGVLYTSKQIDIKTKNLIIPWSVLYNYYLNTGLVLTPIEGEKGDIILDNISVVITPN